MERKVYIITPESEKSWQETTKILLKAGFVFNQERHKTLEYILNANWHWPEIPNFLIGYGINADLPCKMVVYNTSGLGNDFGYDVITISIEDFVKYVLPIW